ncbi:MAG: hypothetical protein AAGE84_21790 [Cyanobacteria bacterium P01_G01_bin.39]
MTHPLCEAVSLYLEIRVSNLDTLEKVVDRGILKLMLLVRMGVDVNLLI